MSGSPPAKELGRRLEAAADERTRGWWSRYLKGVVPFRGVPMAGVRRVVHELWADRGLHDLPRDDQLDLALSFFAARDAEDKLAGILVLAEVLLDRLDARGIPRLPEPFERGHVADWSTCDWYSVKVPGELIASGRPGVAQSIASWSAAEGLWQRRAAAVSFVKAARRGEEALPGIVDLVFAVCALNARDPERFSQTSVGWVLSEPSHAEPGRVAAWVGEHRDELSREAVRMATAKLPPRLRAGMNPEGRRR